VSKIFLKNCHMYKNQLSFASITWKKVNYKQSQ
jgi:hypothetical protein